MSQINFCPSLSEISTDEYKTTPYNFPDNSNIELVTLAKTIDFDPEMGYGIPYLKQFPYFYEDRSFMYFVKRRYQAFLN